MAAMNSLTLSVCQVDRPKIPPSTLSADQLTGEALIAVVTWIPKEKIFQIGLPRGSVCGVLREGTSSVSADNFVPNRDFIDILHYLNTHHLDPGLVSYAAQTPEKSIAIIDQRSPDVNAAIPPEDILGVYDVQDGKVTGYQANPNYRLVTEKGAFKLTPWLRECLVSAVLRYHK